MDWGFFIDKWEWKRIQAAGGQDNSDSKHLSDLSLEKVFWEHRMTQGILNMGS